jgi:DNA-binding IclR family transcriptional regulator
MALGAESNKAKIARRVVEVLDYFDDQHPQATVMDIVRRYDRPQSSTSELLSSLVELGLLFKDPYTRSYSLTPRAALLGAIAQPEMIRSGGMASLIDRLVAQTGLGVGLFSMVGLNVQINAYKAGAKPVATANPKGISSGLQDQLCNAAAGWLLLSTIPMPRREGVLRRLNAEAAPEHKFQAADMAERISHSVATGHSQGLAGFGTIADGCCMLLPGQPAHQPLVVGFFYEPSAHVDVEALQLCLRDACERSLQPATLSAEPVAILSSAA